LGHALFLSEHGREDTAPSDGGVIEKTRTSIKKSHQEVAEL
jgi:hypothetical protein